MKIRSFRLLGLIAMLIPVVYLLAYCGLIHRSVLRTASNSEGRSQMIALAELRGFGSRSDTAAWKIFEPAFYIDRTLIRRDYWATHWETK